MVLSSTHRTFSNLKSITRLTRSLLPRQFLSTMNPKIKVNLVNEPVEISNHFGPSPHKFVPIEKQTFYCKDSRGDEENFGAPGGDFGEFLLALECFKRSNPSEDLNVDEIFERWLKERCSKERPFYLHSDKAALNRLLKSINYEYKEELNVPLRDIKNQGEFIEKFGISGEFHGCGHLRLILEEPSSYSINLKLFSRLIRAFFIRYFNGDERLMFKVYDIPQNGCALVVIDGPNTLKQSILSTQCINPNHQIFILNQHAVSTFRKHYLVPFFIKEDQVEREKMLEEMETLGWMNAMFSAKKLAGDKPIYKVNLTEQ